MLAQSLSCPDCGNDKLELCRSGEACWWQCRKCLTDIAPSPAPPQESHGVPDDVSCPHCGSFKVENREPKRGRPYNYCPSCRKRSSYLPSKASIAAAIKTLPARKLENENGDLTPQLIAFVKTCVLPDKEAGRAFNISQQTANHIRQGRYDHRKRKPLCERCRGAMAWESFDIADRRGRKLVCVTCRAKAFALENSRPKIDIDRYADPVLRDRAALPLSAVLDVRSSCLLEKGHFYEVSQYLAADDESLLGIPNLGAGTIRKIDKVLASLGLIRENAGKLVKSQRWFDYRKVRLNVWRAS